MSSKKMLYLLVVLCATTVMYRFIPAHAQEVQTPSSEVQPSAPADATDQPSQQSSWGRIKTLYRGQIPVEETSETNSVTRKLGTQAMAAAPQWCWNWKFPFCGSWQISCKYGCYKHTGQDQYAIDWNLPGSSDLGQPVFAPASGWQVWSGWYNGYGNCIIVDTGNGVLYRLAHFERLRWPSQTRYVYQGQTLGWCGATGGDYSPHIHFSVHYPASNAGFGRINGPSVPQEGISGQWTLNTGSYYPSGQSCQSW